MRNKHLCLIPCLLLAACATHVPLPPEPAPLPPQASCPPIIVPPPPPPAARPASDIEGLLAYHQSLHLLSPTDLGLELSSLGEKPPSPHLALQKAMVLGLLHGNGNLARAQAQLAGVLTSTDPAAAPLKPLARLLASMDAELQRQAEQLEKSTQLARENQRRIDQLNGMLEGLKAIERTLPSRPSALTPPAPLPPAPK